MTMRWPTGLTQERRAEFQSTSKPKFCSGKPVGALFLCELLRARRRQLCLTMGLSLRPLALVSGKESAPLAEGLHAALRLAYGEPAANGVLDDIGALIQECLPLCLPPRSFTHVHSRISLSIPITTHSHTGALPRPRRPDRHRERGGRRSVRFGNVLRCASRAYTALFSGGHR